MATSRFFLANLPSNTEEKDLINIFQDYGTVTKVELKTMESLVDPENFKTIAFVTLEINEADVQYCLNELSWQKIKGCQIKVSLAKESFLERLKREREESESKTTGPDNSLSIERNADLLTKNVTNTRKKFSDDLEFSGDDEVSSVLLITKRKASSSIFNGKISIQGCDINPIHVITSKPNVRQLDAKSIAADQKRKQSLNQKKTQYRQNKSAIQQALASENGNASMKIKFSDSEIDVENSPPQSNSMQKPSVNIFGSDDEAERNLDLKPQYFGKKGEKLLQLQSGQSLDPRFKINATFVDGEDDNDVGDEEQEDERCNERDWQIGILEQVVGTKIDAVSTNDASKNRKMLRFDPLKNEHKKFLRGEEIESATKTTTMTKKPKTKYRDRQVKSTEQGPEVSKEIFYMVTDSLSHSLKTRGDGFSLLNMFGNAGTQSGAQREDNLKKFTHEKIIFNKTDKDILNPFSYDSSSFDSEDDMQLISGDTSHDQTQNQDSRKGKVKIVVETFFIPKNDARLKDGAKFFLYKKSESSENYDDVRNRLKILIKTKISKSKKHFLEGRRKGKSKV